MIKLNKCGYFRVKCENSYVCRKSVSVALCYHLDIDNEFTEISVTHIWQFSVIEDGTCDEQM